MHREISHAGNNLQPESRLSLYLLTSILALLIGADLWLWLSTGADDVSLFGLQFRLALVPAILGGARILYGSLDSLFEGRIGADLAIAVACVAAILARRPRRARPGGRIARRRPCGRQARRPCAGRRRCCRRPLVVGRQRLDRRKSACGERTGR